MISGLRVGNFKGFGDAQEIPVRPLTLIYGPNSAGKSSIIHSIALIHQAVTSGDLDVHYPALGGDSVDLGGFRQYVHRKNAFETVEWGVRFDDSQDQLGISFHIGLPQEEILEQRSAAESNLPNIAVPTGRFRAVGAPRIETLTIEQGGEPLVIMARRPEGNFFISRLFTNHAFFQGVFARIITEFTTAQTVKVDDLSTLSGAAADLVPTLEWDIDGVLPGVVAKDREAAKARSDSVIPVSRGRREADLANAVRMFLPRVLDQIVADAVRALKDQLDRLVYLGPLRSYPPRHLAFSEQHDLNWRAGGGWAWDVVRKRADVRGRVNRWLGSGWLKTPYELVLRDLLPADTIPSDISPMAAGMGHDLVRNLLLRYYAGGDKGLDELDRIFNDIDQEDESRRSKEIENAVSGLADSEELTRKWIEQLLAESDERPLQDLVFIDKRSGTWVSHRDVGIGISQALPVLITSFASERQLIAIEQPELHLHPAIQAELADVFIEATLGGGGNAFLIETHSEHLLLRIKRRMRETFEERLSKGAYPLQPSDVCVLYVEPEGARSIVREMPLNERGELVKSWPEGFFEEGLREVFA